MNKNVLYRTTFIRKIYCTDKIITSERYFRLRYGTPLEKDYIINDWADFLRDRNYIDDFKGYTDRKGRLYCEALNGIDQHVSTEYKHKKGIDLFPERVYKDDFIYMEAIYNHEILDNKNVSMKNLLDELSVEETTLFLKDNEITYLPNLK